MIDRTPDLYAARTAARDLDAELVPLGLGPEGDLGNAEDFEKHVSSQTPSAIAASRGELVKLLSLIVLNASTTAAKRWGAHWVYSQPECELVACATLDVLELYIPDFNGPWMNLALVLGVSAVPRILGPKLPPLPEESTPTKPATATPPSSSNGATA